MAGRRASLASTAIRAYLGEDFQARPFTIANWTSSGRRVSEYMYRALGGSHTGDALVTTPVLGSHHGEYRGVMRWAHEMASDGSRHPSPHRRWM